MNPQPFDEAVEVTWENLIPPEHWSVYACVLDRACNENVPFALGGGLALGYYTGHLRRSKDLDIYIRPEDRETMVRIMTGCKLKDFHPVQSYDPAWIYRGHRGDVIVDAIWAMANKRTVVDDRWIDSGPLIQLCGQSFRVIPAEELIWSKLYVLQRDRCDWPDIFNLVYATGPHLDWEHLFARVAEDRPLLKGILSIFSWLCPGRALALPHLVWDAVDLPVPRAEGDPAGRPSRKDLLDSRPWLLADNRCAA